MLPNSVYIFLKITVLIYDLFWENLHLVNVVKKLAGYNIALTLFLKG